MYEARGVATCGGGQLVARMGDLPDQVHGFGVGGSKGLCRYASCITVGAYRPRRVTLLLQLARRPRLQLYP